MGGLTAAVAAGYLAAAIAPFLGRFWGQRSGWVLALAPMALAVYFATLVPGAIAGQPTLESASWLPDLGINLAFRGDGLSLLFALMITVIGAFILVFAGGYLKGHPRMGRFYALILVFMASMLGLTLADNLIVLFVFWELTSVSSYLLIGFDDYDKTARDSALQALLVTGGGGLALMAGLILLGMAAGSYSIGEVLVSGDAVRQHPLALPILLLVLTGAFTKSAQVPFHFWLPNAMAAPTPVSAYLHSATMVKAGVFLLARLYPVFEGMQWWFILVAGFGAATMVMGTVLALGQSDLKRILAYSTLSMLGMLVMLLGIGGDNAIKAMVVVLVAHALYKASLFMVAGSVDHETGSRDVTRLSGLRRLMPITAAAAALAGLSMAALPPFLGFVAKEKALEAALHAHAAQQALTWATVVAGALMVALAAQAAWRPFWGNLKTGDEHHHPHEAPIAIWLGPAALAAASLALGFVGNALLGPLLSSAASTVAGKAVSVDLHLWAGFNEALGLSALAAVMGIGVYLALLRWPLGGLTYAAGRFGPERWYELALAAMNWTATAQTRLLQSEYLRYYVMITMLAGGGLAGFTLWVKGALFLPSSGWDFQFYELGIVALIIGAAVAGTLLRARLAAAMALGVAGYGLAAVFIVFGAPDLAMTQILVETLTVVLFVLVFYHLPPHGPVARVGGRLRDAAIAVGAGALMTALVLAVATYQVENPVSSYYGEQSLTQAHGRNVVNVILVDFRALDTLGEITVLSVAAIGVIALLKLRSKD